MVDKTRLVYQTSFSPDLYEASGKDLLASWARIGQPDRMMICPEGLCSEQLLASKVAPLDIYSLDNDEFLRSWLAANRDIVPDYLGGDAKECTCEDRARRHGKHVPRCHYSWMNRNAYRWLRKVASWKRAAECDDIDVLIWVDSDCLFEGTPPRKLLQRFFDNTSVFYFRAHRPAVESGIVGFDFRRQGRQFIRAVCDRYTSGDFRRFERWDDGFIVGTVVDDKVVATRDVCPPVIYRPGTKKIDNHVMPYTKMWEYIHHRKSLHGSGMDIMR